MILDLHRNTEEQIGVTEFKTESYAVRQREAEP